MAYPSVQLSFSGALARILPDDSRSGGYVLELAGAEQSQVDLAHPENIFYEYLRRIGHIADLAAESGQPLTTAHLGAGALTLARYIQATRPGSMQVAVDIERELPGFVLEHLPLPAGTMLKVLIEDARAVLPALAPALNGAAPELIVLDVFSGWSAPQHLTELGFYEEVREVLDSQGFLAVNVGDDPGLSFFADQAQKMLEVFEHVWCLADSSMLTGRQAGNLILVGSAHALDTELRTYLLGAGPHPAAVLDTYELTQFLEELAGN